LDITSSRSNGPITIWLLRFANDESERVGRPANLSRRQDRPRRLRSFTQQFGLPAPIDGVNRSSGLEIGPDIPDGTETIVEHHKFARFLLWIMASIHVQVG
jgi:hypothetical protein